jgi:hypothetical protein
MDTNKTYTGVASAAKDYFGDHPNGSTKFLLEWKSLTEDDKKEIFEGWEKLGYKVEKKV